MSRTLPVDAHTTPTWLRPIQLVFLLMTSVAFADASFHAMEQHSFRQYLMGWKMFTGKNTRGTDHSAEVNWTGRGGDFVQVDLHSYFPSQWDSGYRYSRFRKEAQFRQVAGALCRRLEKPAHAVRIIQTRWTLVAGSIEGAEARDEVLTTHRCDRPVRTIGGRTIPLHPDTPEKRARADRRRPRGSE